MKIDAYPKLILIISVLLILLNIITEDVFDLGFWFRILASFFIILAAIKMIKKNKKNNFKK